MAVPREDGGQTRVTVTAERGCSVISDASEPCYEVLLCAFLCELS